MCLVMAVVIIVVGIICLFFFLLDFSYRAKISYFLWHSLSRTVALDTHDPLNKVPSPEQGQLTEPPLSHSPRPIPHPVPHLRTHHPSTDNPYPSTALPSLAAVPIAVPHRRLPPYPAHGRHLPYISLTLHPRRLVLLFPPGARPIGIACRTIIAVCRRSEYKRGREKTKVKNKTRAKKHNTQREQKEEKKISIFITRRVFKEEIVRPDPLPRLYGYGIPAYPWMRRLPGRLYE